MNEVRCICCERLLDEEPTDNPMTIHPVYNGLIFRATGNFGSTIFDPIPFVRKEILQVIICDDCIKRKKRSVIRIYDITECVTAKEKPFEID